MNGKWLSSLLVIVIFSACNTYHVPMAVPGVNNLYLLSDGESRSISPENLSGGKGKGGMLSPEEGNATRASKKYGWKTNPYLFIQPGETRVLAEAEGPGIINHIWLTPARDGNDRLRILRFYWDDETEPSVEVPLGDFFCNAWDHKNQVAINSLPVSVNPLNGFNSFWQMPFRKKFKITLENKADTRTRLFYQVNYTLTEVPKEAAYFHAQFRRLKKVPFQKEYVILDGVQGKGQYVGTFLSRGTYSNRWWGEGEVKFFIDGDEKYPTINTTGEEDYFLGSWGYASFDKEGNKQEYTDYNTPYAGFYKTMHNGDAYGRFGQYRWHIYDPVRFQSDLKVTMQVLGWDDDGNYFPLEDDVSSVAFWYQLEPHQTYPKLPGNEVLRVQE